MKEFLLFSSYYINIHAPPFVALKTEQKNFFFGTRLKKSILDETKYIL
jgi:hypothetical protein